MPNIIRRLRIIIADLEQIIRENEGIAPGSGGGVLFASRLFAPRLFPKRLFG